ncbi:MAG TPA: biopolymer transporter ExbD [Trueperaceae bacterium]
MLGRDGPGIDLTPMVDVAFQLIIFFMVSTTFITLQSGLPVDLPSAQSSQVQASDLPTVTVTRDNKIFVLGTQVSEEALIPTLQDALQASGQGTVVFRADQNVLYGYGVHIFDLIKQSGAERIAIATGGG